MNRSCGVREWITSSSLDQNASAERQDRTHLIRDSLLQTWVSLTKRISPMVLPIMSPINACYNKPEEKWIFSL